MNNPERSPEMRIDKHHFMAILRPNTPDTDVVSLINGGWIDKKPAVNKLNALCYVSEKESTDIDVVMYAGDGLINIIDVHEDRFLEHLETAVENIVMYGGNTTISLLQLDSYHVQNIDAMELLEKKRQHLVYFLPREMTPAEMTVGGRG